MPFRHVLLRTTKPRTSEGLAYAAGLYEGEGTITAYYGSFYLKGTRVKRQRKTPTIHMKIAMADIEPLEKFQDAIGLGNITGPYAGVKRAHKPIYHWTANGFEEVQAVAVMLWPRLSPRRKEQIINALKVMIPDEPVQVAPAT